MSFLCYYCIIRYFSASMTDQEIVQAFVYRKPGDGQIRITMTKHGENSEARHLVLKNDVSMDDALKIVGSIKMLAENDTLDNAMRDYFESTRN